MGATQSVQNAEGEVGSKGTASGLTAEDVAQMTYSEFTAALASACKEEDIGKFAELWQLIYPVRMRDHPNFDDNLISDNCMKYLKFAFRHRYSRWREVGVRVCRTFFHLPEAREKLVSLDFVGSMMLLGMPEDEGDEEDEDGEGGKAAADKQQTYQVLAAETILEMADYPEFMGSLCSTSVLNFLCVALNQVPETVEKVAHTFVKISVNPENLHVFIAGSVGDILESFFKSTNYQRKPTEQWARDISALSYCAHTMGTMIKYDHACQVDMARIGAIFASMPDNTRLIAEMSRLFYWICRKSTNLRDTLMASAPGVGGSEGLDTLLFSLVTLWNKAVDVQDRLRNGGDLTDFCVDDIDRTPFAEGSESFFDKIVYAEMRLCYLNCLLWELLPENSLRWRLRSFGLSDLHRAFELKEEVLLQVILGTVRHILDKPEAQECHELIKFFGEQLMLFVDMAIHGLLPDSLVRLLLDGISILSFQRSMQLMLADCNIWGKLNRLIRRWQDRNPDKRHLKVELAVLRIMSQVAVHPSHRLGWVAKDMDPSDVYPPRAEFEQQLQNWAKGTDESFQTIATMLLTIFNEQKFQREPDQLQTTFQSILDWWEANSTTHYHNDSEAVDAPKLRKVGSSRGSDAEPDQMTLKQMLEICHMRQQERRALSSMETLQVCAPYECILALSLFSRLALEPKFKPWLYANALEALLGCVCLGHWAEAREAAACLANLMWMPDLDRERLVCWLKFDGPRCITVDAANVLMPVRAGSPQPVAIGKGMYRSTWGMEFVKGSCVTLHPDGFKTYDVPGLLTSASPPDTFENTSQSPYQWLADPPDPRHWTVTCWFYWPLHTDSQADARKQSVLLQSAPPERQLQLYVDYEDDPEGVWTIVDHTRTKWPLKTPKLQPGWHMLTLVSSTSSSPAQDYFDGTRFFLDDFGVSLKNVWVINNFYMIGNDVSHGGQKPFGLIADFRIYARCLAQDEIDHMVTAEGTNHHPDKIAKQLAALDAAAILAQRLDVPDSAAECLRALGSLATVSSERSRIANVCVRPLLTLLESPLPMIQRQAARLMSNLT
eukprot:TRINITY_DN91323_c0_g1_i1.p1 TRINITY_DN91323_c0_g1~~TRINITY_DN91323_c0_g1_i1.p1  ORF type:complete len:1061 (+),score=214.42 TRINITY_DN91323_c0_g1_i1:117-3299(+)